MATTSLADLAGRGQQPIQADLAAMVPQPPMAAPMGGGINKQIEQEYFDRLANDFDGLKAEYAQVVNSRGENTTDGGRILNTDDARELSPHYRADRTKSADVHEPASAFVKQMYADKLANPTPPGMDNTVVFTAGGTGAGKTTGLKQAMEVDPRLAQAEIVYDTNMNKFASADQKIRQALDAGRNVSVVYTFRDPTEALTEGALTRASGMEAELGTGRTVPLDEHFKTHVGAYEVMKQLQDQYGDDHRFSLKVIDNSRGRNRARVVSSLDELPKLDHTKVRKELDDALENAYRTGKISQAIYQGTRVNAR
jgi:hypothetical protein